VRLTFGTDRRNDDVRGRACLIGSATPESRWMHRALTRRLW
jgi:hypothetical protein